LTLTRTVLPLLSACALAAPMALVAAPAASAAPRTASSATTLSQGASGTAVKRLQRLLAKAGFAVAVDGEYGSDTTKAVRAFQGVTGLTGTGAADASTVRLLSATTRSAGRAASANNGGFSEVTPRSKTLGDRLPVRRGMSGHDVKVLQGFLRKAGVRRVNVDGQFGRGTQVAVRRWERTAQRHVDGVVDAGDAVQLRDEVGAPRGTAAAATTPAAGKSTTTAAPAPTRLAPGDRATIGPDGLAVAPASAPVQVRRFIAAGNQIAKKTYIYGGGHRADWKLDRGYDCSGSVSWGLHGAGLVKTPMPSGSYTSWGLAGPGRWITIYTKSSHMYAVVAGLRFDTSGRSARGTRWQTDMRSAAGYTVRHPEGL
jgi:peptidoglycan hydrolase-like protein with peptidoglycan-binding domain